MESEKGKVDIVKMDTEKKDETEDESEFRKIKCRYFNKGFCKYQKKCRYLHPKNTCREF